MPKSPAIAERKRLPLRYRIKANSCIGMVMGVRAPQMRKRKDKANKQNTSDAVMAQRGATDDELDDFPTPPWATRAFITKVIPNQIDKHATCVEPAAGRGYMSEVLKEKFARVDSFDIGKYNGYCPALPGGFLENSKFDAPDQWDWCITNPPFKLAEEFVRRGLHVARRGVAMLCRTVIIEGQTRFDLYNVTPPSLVAQYAERVPMVEAQFDPKASTATGYCWIVWDKQLSAAGRFAGYPNDLPQAPLCWIPPCRKELERPYERINALLTVVDNERNKASDIALGSRTGTDEDAKDHLAKAADRHATACKELAVLKAAPDWSVTKKLLREVDGSRLTPARIAELLGA